MACSNPPLSIYQYLNSEDQGSHGTLCFYLIDIIYIFILKCRIPSSTLIFMPYDSQGIYILDPATFSYKHNQNKKQLRKKSNRMNITFSLSSLSGGRFYTFCPPQHQSQTFPDPEESREQILYRKTQLQEFTSSYTLL